MVFLNVPVMQQPEAYIGNASNLFDEEGDLASDSTREHATIHARIYSLGCDEHGRREAVTKGALSARMQFPLKGGLA